MNSNLEELFSIDKFNVYSDEENYYFFRALEELDVESINNKNIVDENGKIVKLITDREFYGATSGYTENSEISLEEVVRHIKMHYDRHTNCISLTSNANTAITYGRQTYDDKYVMIKVPKSEINKSVYPAGLYMLEEINKKINELISNHDLDDHDMQKYFMDAIDNCKTEDQLETIRTMLPKKNNIDDRDIYENGLEFDITDSKNYQALNKKQNFEKDKIILKLDVLNKRLIPRMSNKFLTQVVGLGFSSLEVVHYKDIEQDRIIELSSEMIDVFGLLQQMPDDLEYIDELKSLILNKYSTYQNNKQFTYKDLEISSELTIDKMYDITGGKVDYKTAINLYKKAFVLAKSKLRIRNSVNVLKEIVNDSKYNEVLNYMEQNGYGIEPEITTRASENLFKVSESVSIDIKEDEKTLLEFINNLNNEQLVYLLNNPDESIKVLLDRFIAEEEVIEKEDWFASSIIDNFNFESLGVRENLSDSQRKDIIIALKENNFLDVYYTLKEQGVKESDISRVLFTNLIKNKNTIDLNDKFTLEQLEWFIGYNRVKGLGLNLRDYQRKAVTNIKNKFADKQFTSVILPTGAGKSYVALEQLYEHRNEKMIYIAPNVEILNQLKSIIKKTYRPEEHLGENIDTIIGRLFPNLTLTTYQNLKNKETNTLKEEFKINYSLIVFDELHRTGASEWMNQISELLDNQDTDTKILGITATPERDMDLKNMADYWAQRYGYSDEEILKGKHLSYNMDIIDAIKLGIIANPKVINCTYSLLNDGSMDNLKLSIEDIVDEEIKTKQLVKYEALRKNIENSNGIEKILNENIKEDSKHIVFLPVTQKNGVYEDEDGNILDKTTAEEIIEKYQLLMRQYIFSYDYLENTKVKELCLKIKENTELTQDEKNYLEQEKKHILLLTKIDIPGKSNALNTDTNLIADTIISYMNWDNIEYKNQSFWLKNLTKDKIEDYSMLGSYSDKKNKKQLDSFNESKNNKIKFMFVMNKLNEGVHVEDISGIIWLRPLDSNSRILYLQQLGRCIKSLDPNKELTEEDIPLVIDLVNNTLKVKLDKGISQYEKDLSNLIFISNWINSNNRYPNYKSKDENEMVYLSILINIKSKYEKYIIDERLIKEQDVKNRLLINEILEVGSDIDLWDQDLPKKVNTSKTKGTGGVFDLLVEIDSIERDFIELNDEVNEIDNSKLSVIQWIKRVQEYCETYHEWPSQGKQFQDNTISDGTTSKQLCHWLIGSGYTKGEFKYSSVEYESGKSIIDILDELYKKYGRINRNSDEAKIHWVKNIQEFCEKYKEWPKYDVEDKYTKDGTTSKRLYEWLYGTSGYINGDFKYADILDENGKTLKEILDELYKKYGRINRFSDESTLLWVKRVQEYCEKYKEWPKGNNTDKYISNGITVKQIVMWLRKTAMYGTSSFKFNDLLDENGKPIKEILDELYKKYGYKNRLSDDIKIEMVKKIEEYCEKYKEWPNQSKKSIDNILSDGTTSKQLYNWLVSSGYTKGKFKFSKVVDENGRLIKDTLDMLCNKYFVEQLSQEELALKYFRNVCNYCRLFKELPNGSEKSENNILSDGTTSIQLYRWLGNSGYLTGNFKYPDVVDENGKLIKEVLDELYKKYGKTNRLSNNNKLEIIKKIQEYCEKYKEWPTSHEYNKKVSDGITSNKLYQWLSNSGYFTGNFKYSNLVDESGFLVKEILDKLYKKYGRINFKSDDIKIQMVYKIKEYCEKYKEWPNQSKKSKNKIISDGTNSILLYRWLNNSGYMKNNFSYTNVVDENGISIKEILDELYKKYNHLNRLSDDIKIEMVKKIEEYCEKYKEWPSLSKKSIDNVLSDGTTSKRLYEWLIGSGYTKGEFKYSSVEYESGKSIKEILDELYYEYKLKKKEDYNKAKEEFDQTSKFNEVVEKVNSNERKVY